MLSSLSRQLGLRARAAAAAGGGGGWAALAAAGALHTSAALAASLQVKIPALGESISDGTVATVLKQAGEQVEEDEAILQIETDKVTVDVRAPRAGVIEAILVKPDENVEVGHVVATISDSLEAAAQPAAAAAPPPEPAAPPPKQPKQKRGAKAAAAPAPAAPPAPAAAAAPPAASHRTPAISFPPRRTPSGELISALPKSEAAQLLAGLLAGGGDTAPLPPPLVPEQYKHMIAVPIVGGSMPILRGPPVPAGPPGPARRTISDREMEAIMLGGADP
ncbi:hypothetical protein CHLNCDRAFT_141351 [Chlorella variabilis]|uniref:Lipoyl-binding domain-containing protein n=1 Tax=Chlorella variabilis TaxID=554065 RepID=E1ZSP6_CHLVA|nr:hypothetical protein CHLNCDRAFT_141351 [Chlorella variabilis]EFN51142.1 hypothetical protein CHLNCDRAFT_141351 [Chlorella variabilis]|eukprot:XP_005843244.1 hypothetical protein CHLNCDRAFT_141351 [Chlorella variabilis]